MLYANLLLCIWQKKTSISLPFMARADHKKYFTTDFGNGSYCIHTKFIQNFGRSEPSVSKNPRLLKHQHHFLLVKLAIMSERPCTVLSCLFQFEDLSFIFWNEIVKEYGLFDLFILQIVKLNKHGLLIRRIRKCLLHLKNQSQRRLQFDELF